MTESPEPIQETNTPKQSHIVGLNFSMSSEDYLKVPSRLTAGVRPGRLLGRPESLVPLTTTATSSNITRNHNDLPTSSPRLTVDQECGNEEQHAQRNMEQSNVVPSSSTEHARRKGRRHAFRFLLVKSDG